MTVRVVGAVAGHPPCTSLMGVTATGAGRSAAVTRYGLAAKVLTRGRVNMLVQAPHPCATALAGWAGRYHVSYAHGVSAHTSLVTFTQRRRLSFCHDSRSMTVTSSRSR